MNLYVITKRGIRRFNRLPYNLNQVAYALDTLGRDDLIAVVVAPSLLFVSRTVLGYLPKLIKNRFQNRP